MRLKTQDFLHLENLDLVDAIFAFTWKLCSNNSGPKGVNLNPNLGRQNFAAFQIRHNRRRSWEPGGEVLILVGETLLLAATILTLE